MQSEDQSLPVVHLDEELDLPLAQSQLTCMLHEIEKGESIRFRFIEVVYLDEESMRKINNEYLGHDYVTDIITFRLDDQQDRQALEATLYCCGSRIFEQSSEYGTEPEEEFGRVFIHGLLHLAGYDDQSPAEQKRMRQLEDRYLTLSNR